MAYMTTVVVEYDINGLAVARSTDLQIESDAPLTTSQIDEQVAGLVDDLIKTPGSPNALQPGQTYTYTWSLESVAEF